MYDVEGNRFRKLDPPRQPGDEPRTVEYIADQKAIFAVIGDGEQWIYSLDKNRWAPLPLTSDGPMGRLVSSNTVAKWTTALKAAFVFGVN